MNRTIIGLDLDKEFSQISYYSERTGEPESAGIPGEPDQFLIPTPEGLFQTTEEAMDLGIMTMANFIRSCILLIRPKPDMEQAYMMVTMRTIRQPWIHAIKNACEMLGMERENVFLQSYRESFFSYVLNQKKELWSRSVALFEYEKSRISAYLMKIDYGTKPALVTVTPCETWDLGYSTGRTSQEWNERRDQKFLKLIQKTFEGENVSSTFLIGDNFDKTWAVESLQYLCRKRHVFQGRNLYTKGACYGMCRKLQIGKNLDAYLYQSEDLVETNLSMQMEIRGQKSNYVLINAGVNWYEAEHTCEILLDDTKELVIYGRSMRGGDTNSYTVVLKGLPERPPRTTRLEIKTAFESAAKCRVTIRDLGFGEFFPSSGLVWESVLDVE